MRARGFPLPRVLPQGISRPGATPLHFSRAQSRRQQNERFSPTGFHCANLAIVRVHQSYRALPRLSRIAHAHDRGSRLRHRLDAPRVHHICAAKLETCRQRSHPLVSAANALHPYPTVTTTAIGPVRDLEAALNGPLDLVATSALLDLVSYSWFKRLAIEVAVLGVALLFSFCLPLLFFFFFFFVFVKTRLGMKVAVRGLPFYAALSY